MRLLFGASLSPLECLEAVLVAFCVGLALLRPQVGHAFFARAEQKLNAIARRPFLSCLVAGLLPVVLRLLLLSLYPPPTPETHDEFSFLLQADTFASGRITNPPHPLWVHFESIYILSQPTYTAKYQPGQGLVLAMGKVLAGSEWAAVIGSMGVLCGLLCWMLRGWLPPSWAFLGAAVAGLQYGVLSYWTNSYWGGTVAAIGGTLVLGALPRVRRGVLPAVVLGLGLGIGMNTRPVEALLLAITVGAYLLWHVFRTHRLPPVPTASRVVLPLLLVLMGFGAAMAYYNWRVTGSAWQLPYSLHIRTYGTPQGYFWQKPYAVTTFRHPEIRAEYERQRALHARRSSVPALLKSTFGRLRTWWSFYAGPALTLPLLFVPWAWRARGVPFALAVYGLLMLVHLTFHAYFPHYAAPVIGLFLLLLLQGWRRLRAWQWQGKPAGLFLARALPVVLAAMVLLPVVGKAVEPALPASWKPLRVIWRDAFHYPPARAILAQQLERLGGQHLVFVRYQPGHNPDHEWVYNGADIDRGPIVWAREWTPESNQALMDWFPGRSVWLAEPDVVPSRLTRIR